MKRILITGATGFLGQHVLNLCPNDKYNLTVFVRKSSNLAKLPDNVIKIIGDLSDIDSFRKALQGIDVLINLASLGFGHAPTIIKTCREAQVPRAIFISTTAVFTRLPAPTKIVRLEAERLIRESELSYTILRPTMIYGTPRDRNIWRLIRFLRFSPFAPLVNGGQHMQQPIHVEDAAKAVWQVLENPVSIGKAYNLAGAQPTSMADLVRIIADHLGKKIRLVHVPIPVALAGATVAHYVPFFPKITKEQILRLEEDKTFDIDLPRKELGFSPLTFDEGIRKELQWLER